MIIQLSEAKNFLRVDITDDDALIQTLIDMSTDYLTASSGTVFDSSNAKAKTVCMMLVAEAYTNRENGQQLRIEPSSFLNGLITQLSCATPIVAPQIPVGLTGASEDGYNRLRWRENIDPDIDGYNVYRDGLKLNTELVKRHRMNDVDYWVWEFEFVPIPPDTPVGVVEFHDSAVVTGDSHNYQVSAVNTLGTESQLSTPVTVIAS